MKKKNLYILLVVIVVVLVIIGLSSGSKKEKISVPEEGRQISEESVFEVQDTSVSEKTNGEDVFNTIVELGVSNEGFQPDEFTVVTESLIKIVLNSSNQKCILKFESPDFQAVTIVADSGEEGSEIFGRPLAGNYTFYCDNNKDLRGMMHVVYSE